MMSAVEQGDIVFAENRYSGSLPDGRPYTLEQSVRHRWRNGLLTEYRNYNDPPVIDGKAVTLEDFFELMSEPTT